MIRSAILTRNLFKDSVSYILYFRFVFIFCMAGVFFPSGTNRCYAQFTNLWTQINNPSGGADGSNAIVADASGVYAAGYDNAGWRIEKRDLNTGVLIPSFGTGGVVTRSGGAINAITLTGNLAIPPAAGQTGANWAGTAVDDPGNGGTFAWNTPANAQGNTTATSTTVTLTGAPVTSDYLKATNFGIMIPAGSTIDGVEVNVEWQTTLANIMDNSVRLVVNGSVSGTNQAISTAIGTSKVTTTYGSPTNTWGLGLTKADVENTNFGVALAVNKTSGPGSQEAYVFRISVVVYYTTTYTPGIYVGGSDGGGIPGGKLRVEKYDLNGALIWTYTIDLSAGNDYAKTITADASGIYIGGYTSNGVGEWHLQKRDLTTGNLVTGFGTGGMITMSLLGTAYLNGITADASGIYLAGSEYTGSVFRWRMEKRDLNTGALIPAFGTSGVVISSPNGSFDHPYAITLDASGIYVAGTQGSSQWRIEKRDLTTGAFDPVFGGGTGAVTNDISPWADWAQAITLDASAFYVSGYDRSPGSSNAQWHVEQRDLSTGALICSTAVNPSSGLDYALGIAVDASGIYVTGSDLTSSGRWRIEKYGRCSLLPSVTASGAVICFGDCATINALATGGTSPYSYSWNSGGQTTSAITVCPTITTTYTVLITDAVSGTATTTTTITVNPQTSVMISPASSTLCFGQSATLSASGGISYSWSPTGQTTTSIVVAPTTNSSYTVTGTDGNGCSNTAISPVIVEPLPFANAGPDISMCAGSSATLNGSGNGSFSWAPSTALNNTTIANPVASPTSAITYTLTVTNNCGTATDEMTITTPASPSASAGNDVTICKGSSTTLLGSGAGSFVWANSATLSCASCQNSIASPTITTTYTLTITDICGSSSDAVTVTVNDPVVSLSPAVTICSGSNTTLTASGVATYNWLPGGQTSAGITVNPTSFTTYTVIGMDAAGCTNTNTTTATVNPLPVITVSNPLTICEGSTATLTASGGTSYSWNPSAQTTAGIIVTPTATTTYSVAVSDGMCTDTAVTTVTVDPDITASIAGVATICAGQSTTLTASGGINYQWNTGAVTNSITVNPTASGATYSVLVSSGTCLDSTNIQITINPLPIVGISGNATICSGTSATLTASGGTSYIWSTTAVTSSIAVSPTITTTYSVIVSDGMCQDTTAAIVTVIPGASASISGNTTICIGQNATLIATGGTNYQWSTGAITGNIIISPTTNSTYSVIVSNGSCIDSTSILINVNMLPTAVLTGNVTICSGQSATLTASGGINYLWSTGSNATSTIVSPGSTSTYTVTVSDSNGCTDTAQAQVTVNASPVAAITGNTTLCQGGSTTLTATGGGNYSWSNGAVTSSISLTPSVSTVYIVTVTSANGCTDTASAVVNVLSQPVAGILCSDTICEGSAAMLTASGGTTYQWSSGQSTSGISVTPTSNTSYTVVVSMGSCKDTASCTVVVHAPPVVNIGADVTITEGQMVTLTASGTSAVSYLWNSGETSQSISVSPIQTTTYCVTVTDNNGCTSQTCVTVTVEPIDCSKADEFFLPNAFSPNEDGENDFLQLYSGNIQCIKTLTISIFDRWGAKVFTSTDTSISWDGKHDGDTLSTAVFMYYLDVVLINGENITKRGNVNLIR